jgi:pilus assembly protein CpaE
MTTSFDDLPPITVLLIDDSTQHNETIKVLLSLEPGFKFIGAETSGLDGVAAAQGLQPDIVLMDINLPDIDGFEATRQILKTVPKSTVIMLSIQDEMNYFNKAMSVGARGYLVKPVGADELYTTIHTAYVNRPQPEPEPEPEPEPRGKIIVVYSPQGGAGCTTLASNLAYGLMRDGARVLLLDANLQFGDVCVVLNLPVDRTLYDLWTTADDLDVEFLEYVTLKHPSGLSVLPGTRRLEDAITMQKDGQVITRIMDQMTTVFDFVVIDTSSYLDDMLLALTRMADRVVLVGTPLLESVKNVRVVRDYLIDEECPRENILLVFNRVAEGRPHKQITLPIAKIENFLGQSIAAQLPLDEMVVRETVKRGMPLIAFDPKGKKPLTQALLNLADELHAALQ